MKKKEAKKGTLPPNEEAWPAGKKINVLPGVTVGSPERKRDDPERLCLDIQELNRRNAHPSREEVKDFLCRLCARWEWTARAEDEFICLLAREGFTRERAEDLLTRSRHLKMSSLLAAAEREKKEKEISDRLDRVREELLRPFPSRPKDE